MRIKRIDISGFKSFCDPVRISLDHSVTAVVGPNGCGKSNIVDAIRWTLGEGSAKALRGSAMEDVIFNGSENRGPKSMAEVTITFDNTDGLSHPDYLEFTEVAVTRRLHRDGTAEYLINKVPCRRRDITDLFLGTGGGARAYSIVEQGRIGLIVSSRSEDRRLMIEEAAGITKYKTARKVSERRMDQTRQNLLRVSDVVSEMERNLANLNRQAKKAERYKKYREEQTDLELHIATFRYLKLRAETVALRSILEEKRRALEGSKNSLSASETRVQQLRLEEQHARSNLDRETAKGYEIDNAVRVAETEIRHLTEDIRRFRHEAESALEQLSSANRQNQQMEDEKALLVEQIKRAQTDLEVAGVRFLALSKEYEEAKGRLSELGEEHDAKRDEVSRSRSLLAASEAAVFNLTRRIDEIEVRLDRIQEERDAVVRDAETLKEKSVTLEQRMREVSGRLEEARNTAETEKAAHEQLKEDVDSCETELRATRDQLSAKKSRKASLEEVMDGMKGHDGAVRDAMVMLEREGQHLVDGLLVDAVRSAEQYEQAVAAALGDRLQALLVSDRASGLKILDILKSKDMGRVAVASPSWTKGTEDGTISVTDPDVLGPLTSFIECDPAIEPFIRNLAAGMFIVSTLDRAEQLFVQYDGRVSFVTLDGQLLEKGGVMRGGRAKTAGAALLGQKREIRSLEEEVTSLSLRHDSLEQRLQYLKDELKARIIAGETARTMAQAEEIALAEVRKDTSRVVEDLAAFARRQEAMDRDIAHQTEILVQSRSDKTRAEHEASTSKQRIDDIERELHARAGEIEACRHEVDRLNAAVSDIRVKKASLDQMLESAVKRHSQLDNMMNEIEERTALADDKQKTAYASVGRSAGLAVRKREILLDKVKESEAVQARIAVQRAALDEAAFQVSEAEESVKKERAVIDAVSKEVSEIDTREQKSGLAMEHCLNQVLERNDCDLLRVIGDYHMRDIPGEDIRARVDELKGLIDRMGPINLSAIQEFEEQNERFQQLSLQKTDLEAALADLEKAISKMDKDSRRRFKETFEDVNERFQKIFPKLFNGGHARLELSDPDDLLGTGVDIFAQPPGKKLGSNELLSGGEKALTAVSLLFAIFLHRPSPFCILDEVDAPLDEANVNRFVDMVHQMTDRSQFIFITHSKVTMEKSDALYGITMEEPGISKVVSVRLTDERRAAGGDHRRAPGETAVYA
jgi:chromosome segregation protein